MQAAHQRASCSGEEWERFHRAAGRQWEQHSSAEEEQRGGDQQRPDVHHAKQTWNPHHEARQQATEYRLPHQRCEALIRATRKPRAEKRRRNWQNKQDAHHHAAQTQHRSHQHAGAGFKDGDSRQSANQHQQITGKCAVAE